MSRSAIGMVALAAVVLVSSSTAVGQGPLSTAFTFRGQLMLDAAPVNQPCDLYFQLFDSVQGGNVVGPDVPLERLGVPVSDGAFVAELDFGPEAFNGAARWLEISVRHPAGVGHPQTLLPRHPIQAVPYALYALGAPGSGGAGDGHSLDAADGRPIDALFVDNRGRVGIGTVTPESPLDVIGSFGAGNATARIANDGQGSGLRVIGTGGGKENAALLIENDNPASGVGAYIATSANGGPAVRIENHGDAATLVLDNGGQGNLIVATDSVLGRNQFWVNDAGVTHARALAVDGEVDNDGATAPVQIADGNANLLLDGNEIDSSAARLFLNNNSAGDVILARGGGHVGIGTNNPSWLLHVAGDSYFRSDSVASDGSGTALIVENVHSAKSTVLFENRGDGPALHTRANSNAATATVINAGNGNAIDASGAGSTRDNATLRVENTNPDRGMAAFVTNDSDWATAHFQNDGSGETLFIRNDGGGPVATMFGNGSTRDDPALRVDNANPDRGMAAYITNDSNWATAHLQNDGAGEVLWLDNNGQGDFIVARDDDRRQFWVDDQGVTHVRVLTIHGGADLSEGFDVRTPEPSHEPSATLSNRESATSATVPEPGMVVCIDSKQSGKLVVSSKAYDRCVAGIISGAAGM